MCLGMESTHWIFSHFVRVDKMEQVAGPIWPFNIAILSFSGAALGRGRIILKKYFETLSIVNNNNK
ncbi:unnamed protein product [Meloidogyne enterolobii]|uniref:Uncharacterized protein n=1 Tax=Meloidogyne enterolobii TaxID=390850 RepID=A0ACB1A598_MELEN